MEKIQESVIMEGYYFPKVSLAGDSSHVLEASRVGLKKKFLELLFKNARHQNKPL